MLGPFQEEVKGLRKKVKAFQSDAEALYWDAATREKYLKGIKLQHSSPYTQAQNGRVEGVIGTIKDKARTYRAEVVDRTGKAFPQRGTSYLYKRANYFRMRGPTASGPDTSPYERLYGVKPDFNGEYFFFDQAWAYEPKELRGPNNDRKAAKCRYLGPSPNMKDSSRVIMMELGGKYGRVVDRYKIVTARGGYHPKMKAREDPSAASTPTESTHPAEASAETESREIEIESAPHKKKRGAPELTDKRKRGAQAPQQQAPLPQEEDRRGRPPERTVETAHQRARGPGRPPKEPAKKSSSSAAPKRPPFAKSKRTMKQRNEVFAKKLRSKGRAMAVRALACSERRR
jgi:hypothetical protein